MKKTFVQEINFLRFLSILFVVVYHFFPNFVNRGYLGVDLFYKDNTLMLFADAKKMTEDITKNLQE